MTNALNVVSMSNWRKRFSLALWLLAPLSLQAAELTGRFSMLGATARAEQGDVGFSTSDNQGLTADQQSLRLMLDASEHRGEWSLHLKAVRQHIDRYPSVAVHSSELFRYDGLAGDWMNEGDNDSNTRIGYEVDRLFYRRRFETTTIGIGRQPIDWGSGRFWQPMNVFGAFSPTDLDTDFKPGVDAATLEWYPTAFSSLTAAFVFAPEDSDEIEDSAAVHYRRQVGAASELSLLAGRVIGNRVVGGALESAWGGMGWRVEGVYYDLEQTDESAWFWIAGADYQFGDGTLIAIEWYDNSRGASADSDLTAMQTDQLVVYGLQQQLGRRLLGIALERDITPLLHGGYTLIAAALESQQGNIDTSFLHQINFSYSVGNESDLLFSLLLPTGRGLGDLGNLRSEFGHVPGSMTLRLRFYF